MKFTLEELGKISNFEINKAVAIKEGHKCYYDKGTYTNGMMGDQVVVKGNGITGCIDYCKSWDDMGRIIHREKIDLRYEGGFNHTWEASHMKHINQYDVDLIGLNESENPLRAAAIVYLMMEQSE